jgi:hypothetical protein
VTNRQSRQPGRRIRRAGPIVGVLATVGIALGAWVGVASATGGGAPTTQPASVTEVKVATDRPTPGTDGDKNTPAVDAAKDKPKGVVEASPKVVSPGKPSNEKTAGPAPAIDKGSRQVDPANPKLNGHGPQIRGEGDRSAPTDEKKPAPMIGK